MKFAIINGWLREPGTAYPRKVGAGGTARESICIGVGDKILTIPAKAIIVITAESKVAMRFQTPNV